MNLKRCENGHFYDADKFASCPHCQPSSGAGNPTQGMGVAGDGGSAVTIPGTGGYMASVESVTPGITAPQTAPQTIPGGGMAGGLAGGLASDIREAMTVPETPGNATVADDDSKTVYFGNTFGAVQGSEPVVGWLVCVKGDYYGQSFVLKTGRNFIGRASNMDIVLAKDNSVSRDRHAIVLYEPKKREFLAQPGDSRSLFYLNDDVVLMTERLSKGDILTLGNTKLMFVPCCGPDFGWDDILDD